MISIDQFERILCEIADQIPEDIFAGLNGGIQLKPVAKIHPEAVAGDLYIMGEYHYDSIMGRSIIIYYGSFREAFSSLSPSDLRDRMEHTLKHEFRHHLESQGGQRDLEIIDSENLMHYKRNSANRVTRLDRQ